jgi:hypothetical protein
MAVVRLAVLALAVAAYGQDFPVAFNHGGELLRTFSPMPLRGRNRSSPDQGRPCTLPARSLSLPQASFILVAPNQQASEATLRLGCALAVASGDPLVDRIILWTRWALRRRSRASLPQPYHHGRACLPA